MIGTERHESRRIDNQLRGRAGRQGDPGSSQFYISAEDDLMRIFGGDRLKNVMNMLKLPEDMPVQNKIVSNSIEKAQQRVEGNNFDLRKHVVEYDDVINKHREAIYRKRREILDVYTAQKEGQDDAGRYLSTIVLEYIESEISHLVNFHTGADNIADWNLQEIYETVKTIFVLNDEEKDQILNLREEKDAKENLRAKLLTYLYSLAHSKYQEMRDRLTEMEIDFRE